MELIRRGGTTAEQDSAEQFSEACNRNDTVAKSLNKPVSWHMLFFHPEHRLLFFLYLRLCIFLSCSPPPCPSPPPRPKFCGFCLPHWGQKQDGYKQQKIVMPEFSVVARTTWHVYCCTDDGHFCCVCFDENRWSPTTTCACHGPTQCCLALVGQVFSTEVLSLLIHCWNLRGSCSSCLEHFICLRVGPG